MTVPLVTPLSARGLGQLSECLAPCPLARATDSFLDRFFKPESTTNGAMRNKFYLIRYQDADASCLVTPFRPETGRRAVKSARAEQLSLSHLLLEH